MKKEDNNPVLATHQIINWVNDYSRGALIISLVFIILMIILMIWR